MLEVSKNRCQIGYDIYSIEMLNLKQLSLQISSVEEFERMNELTVKWNLEKLYLDFDKNVGFIDWPVIIKLVKNKWADSLVNLMINLPQAKTNEEKLQLLTSLSSENIQLDLPNVKRLKLIISNQIRIDFILPMKDKIEVFEIGFLYECARSTKAEIEQAESSNQVLQIVGYEERLYESNIWKLFPKLERIQVWNEESVPICKYSVEHLYTRDNWEREMKKLANQ